MLIILWFSWGSWNVFATLYTTSQVDNGSVYISKNNEIRAQKHFFSKNLNKDRQVVLRSLKELNKKTFKKFKNLPKRK